jgi:hypothetical protein
MLTNDDFICPICGLILPALAAYHQHYAREHQSRKSETSRDQFSFAHSTASNPE